MKAMEKYDVVAEASSHFKFRLQCGRHGMIYLQDTSDAGRKKAEGREVGYDRRVGTTLEVGRPWKGGPGVLPREKISKMKANCKHFRAFGAISVYGNYNERLLILQKTKKMLRSGTNITLPREKNSKIEANCKHSQAFGAILVYMAF